VLAHSRLTLSAGSFDAVSLLFHPCYGGAPAAGPDASRHPCERGRYRWDVAGTQRTGSQRAANPSPGVTRYPGEKFGLPADGPGAVARYGRRLAALLIDWVLSSLVAALLLRFTHGSASPATRGIYDLAVFAAEVYLLTALTGQSAGKRLLGLRVVRPDGGPAGFGWIAVRTLLLLAVVPPVVYDRDLRGLHDRAANTIVVRT
jgi:uncharacterized RDD family membrane protein YckC